MCTDACLNEKEHMGNPRGDKVKVYRVCVQAISGVKDPTESDRLAQTRKERCKADHYGPVGHRLRSFG